RVLFRSAQTDASSGRGVAVMLVLGPHEQTEAQAPRGPLETGRADSPESRPNSQTAQGPAHEEEIRDLENDHRQEEPAGIDRLPSLIGTSNVSILESAPVIDVPNELESGDLMVVCVSRWLDSRRWKDLGHEFIIEAEVQCPVQGRGGAVGAAVTEADRRGCR